MHTSGPHQTGRTAVRIFGEEGVDLTKVVIGHAGDSNDIDYLKELADTGVLLGMDRFGLDLFNPTAERVKTIAILAGQGYAGSMVLSHDASCMVDFVADDFRNQPNWNWDHLVDNVIPVLLQRGVTQAQIDQMTIDNPRRFFSGE